MDESTSHGGANQSLEAVLANLLRRGVMAASAVVVIGGLVYLARHGAEQPDYHVFRGEPADLCSVPGILDQVIAGRGRGVIQLGLLLLIATPVLRVIAAGAGFALRRDKTYVAVSLLVLAGLAYSLLGGQL